MKLPKGETWYVKGKAWTGEIPDGLVPDELQPKPPAEKPKAKPKAKKED